MATGLTPEKKSAVRVEVPGTNGSGRSRFWVCGKVLNHAKRVGNELPDLVIRGI